MDLNEERGRILVYTNSEREVDLVRSWGANWNRKERAWSLPVEWDFLRSAPSGVVLGTNLLRAASRERARQNELIALSKAKSVDLPERVSVGLEDYQKVGVAFLAKAGSAILADEPGVGKTPQAIRACVFLDAQKVLVVCPKVMVLKWQDHIFQWANEEAQILLGSKRDVLLKNASAKYLITTYETLSRFDALRKMEFDVLIADEATRIKNKDAKRTKAVLEIRAKRTFFLTGTPMLNNPSELWTMLHKINPKRFSSFWRFAERYCFVDVEEFGDGRSFRTVYGCKDPNKLASVLAPIMLRRTKEILGLPPKTTETVKVRLEGQQKKLYKDMLKEIIVEFDGKIVKVPSLLSRITRLRQVSIDPRILFPEAEPGAKTDAVIDLIEDYHQEYPVVVFSWFREYIDILAGDVGKKLGISPAVIVGGMAATKIEEERRKFQEGRTDVILGTIGAMSEGIELHRGRLCIFTDRHWTPAQNMQAEDRLHRRGQKNPVHVIVIHADRTIDDYIETVLNRKDFQINSVLEAKNLLTFLSRSVSL